jgi:Flp pilus assembly protein TadG
MDTHRGRGPDGIGDIVLPMATWSDRIDVLRRAVLPLARRLHRETRGNIAILAGLSIFILLGAAGVALDMGKIYLAKSTAQRIADQSALSAAYAYAQSGNTLSSAQTAASNLAQANGALPANVSTQIITAPANDDNSATQVSVTLPVPLSPFSGLQQTFNKISVNVSASATAEMFVAAPCIISLNSTGVVATGSGKLTGTGCTVTTGGDLNGISGTSMNAKAFYANGSNVSAVGVVTTSPTSGMIQTHVSTPVWDPYSAAGSSLFSRLSTVATQSLPTFPTSVGTAPTSGSTGESCTSAGQTLSLDSKHSYSWVTNYVSNAYYACTINFTGGTETDVSQGLSISGAGPVTVNFCPGTYKINDGIAISNVAVTMNVTTDATICGSSAGGAVVLDVWGNGSGSAAISTSGTASLTFNGPASFYLYGGINAGSSGAMSFTNGSGTATSAFYVHGGIALENGGPVSFPDGAYFVDSGMSGGSLAGIDVGGSVAVTFGNGSFNIACGINIGASASLTFGSALATTAQSPALFRVNNKQSSGTACESDAINGSGASILKTGNFTYFDINGNVNSTGSIYFGSGLWTINGFLDADASGGSTLQGTDIQIVTSGQITIGQGYNKVDLTAPSTITTSTYGSAPSIVLASNSSAGTHITQGASSTTFTGAIYLPNSALTLDNNGSMTGNGSCMVLDVASITLGNSGAISTDCTGVNATGPNSIVLVQ